MDHGGADWRDRAIRDAVLAGNTTVWRAWFAEYFDPLVAYVCWRCGGLRELTDDVIQETWLTAVRRLSSFDPGRGPFFAWLCGIASNTTRNALRSRHRHRRRSRPLALGDDPPAQELDTVAVEQAERIAQALAALPDHYESVLRAKYLDQLSVGAIAAARGDSMKAVESLLTRARQAFREAYETACHD